MTDAFAQQHADLLALLRSAMPHPFLATAAAQQLAAAAGQQQLAAAAMPDMPSPMKVSWSSDNVFL